MIGIVGGQYSSSANIKSGFDAVNRINFGRYHNDYAYYSVSLWIGKPTASNVYVYLYDNYVDITVCKYNFD